MAWIKQMFENNCWELQYAYYTEACIKIKSEQVMATLTIIWG